MYREQQLEIEEALRTITTRLSSNDSSQQQQSHQIRAQQQILLQQQQFQLQQQHQQQQQLIGFYAVQAVQCFFKAIQLAEGKNLLLKILFF